MFLILHHCIAKSDELETCFVKYNNFESFLKELLLVKQHRVEIWKKNKNGEWILTNHVCYHLLKNIVIEIF